MKNGVLKLIQDLQNLNFNCSLHTGLLLDLGMAVDGSYPGIKPIEGQITEKEVIQIFHFVCQDRYEISKNTVIKAAKEVFGEKGFPIINQKLKRHMTSYQYS